MARADLVGAVEIIYRVEEADERTWLGAIVAQAMALVGRAHRGAYGLEYDASDVSSIRFSNLVMCGVDDPALAHLLEVDCQDVYRENPELVESVFRRTGHAPSRRLPGAEHLVQIHAALQRRGVHEILGVNGVNVEGRSAHFGVLLSRSTRRIGPEALSRLSTHLAAAFRLRRRLGDGSALDRADAVLEPGGKIAHAQRDAKLKAARTALADAAVRLDRLRATARRRDPERALRSWRALVDARWSLIDHFERDGRRYILAERNDPDLNPLALLSNRERQVVALAAVGHANKMIGYELGISVSTVGVLLARAARRLGASSRRELIAAHLRASKDSPGHPGALHDAAARP